MILHTPKYANLLDYFYMTHNETVDRDIKRILINGDINTLKHAFCRSGVRRSAVMSKESLCHISIFAESFTKLFVR